MTSPIKNDNSIKNAGNLGVSQTQTRASKGSDSAAPAAPVTSPATDSVSLSSQAQAVAGQLASTGVFDARKVEQIKAAIADGTFKVDPEKVAAGLLDSVTDLLQSRKSQK